MSAVGLLHVGAVLFVNGMMLLGHISSTGAAPLNFFVGTLQVVVPTCLIVSSGEDSDRIAGAAGLYFFGFTYLWLGINLVTGWAHHGLGWFSLTVAVSGIGFAVHSRVAVGDRVLTVQWLMWATMMWSRTGSVNTARSPGRAVVSHGPIVPPRPAADHGGRGLRARPGRP